MLAIFGKLRIESDTSAAGGGGGGERRGKRRRDGVQWGWVCKGQVGWGTLEVGERRRSRREGDEALFKRVSRGGG